MSELTKNEELILLLIWRLKKDAYGVPLRQNFKEITGKMLNYGALYNILYQMERKGLVISKESKPEAKKGGRRKIMYSVTKQGIIALKKAQEIQKIVWQGISDYAFDEKVNE